MWSGRVSPWVGSPSWTPEASGLPYAHWVKLDRLAHPGVAHLQTFALSVPRIWNTLPGSTQGRPSCSGPGSTPAPQAFLLAHLRWLPVTPPRFITFYSQHQKTP